MVPEANVRLPEPLAPGQAERIDYEYERLGMTNLFFFVEPLSGCRHVETTERRTKLDYTSENRSVIELPENRILGSK